MGGVFVFLFFVVCEYLCGLGWLFGFWDLNMGYVIEDEFILKVNCSVLLIVVVFLVWVFMGFFFYCCNWEIEVMGIGIGMLLVYVVIICFVVLRVKRLFG